MSVLVPYHSVVTFVACYILYLEIKVLFYLIIFLANYQYLFFQVNLRTCCSYLLLHNKPLQIQWLRTQSFYLFSQSVGQVFKQGWPEILFHMTLTRVIWWYLPVCWSTLKGLRKLNSHVRQLRGDESEGRIIQALSFSV